MRLYLIDYENVNSTGLHGIGQVSPNDRIILFYSHSANTLSFEVMDEMLSAGITPERICLNQGGKNALDFQLVTLLGYMIANQSADEYFIISKDCGYSAAVTLCKEYLHTKVQLKPSLKAALAVKPVKPAKNANMAVPSESSAAAQPKKQTKTSKPAKVALHKRATVIQVQPMNVTTAQAVVPAAKPAKHEAKSIPNAITIDTVLSLVELPINAEIAGEILRCLNESKSKTEFHNALQQHFSNDDVKEYYRCMKPCFSIALNDCME